MVTIEYNEDSIFHFVSRVIQNRATHPTFLQNLEFGLVLIHIKPSDVCPSFLDYYKNTVEDCTWRFPTTEEDYSVFTKYISDNDTQGVILIAVVCDDLVG